MLSDLRYAWRLTVRTPLLSGVAIAALALGIGTTTSLFSVVHAVLLKPLPYAEPERLVVVATRAAPSQRLAGAFDYALRGAEAAAIQELTDVFERVSVAELWTVNWSPRFALQGPADTERIRGGLVDAEFFETLGVQPLIGRAFQATDRGGDGVVISYGLWRRHFGEGADVLGRELLINGEAHHVIGVLPQTARLTYPLDTDAFTLRATDVVRPQVAYQVIARLKPNISVDGATAALARTGRRGDPMIRGELEVQQLHARMIRPAATGIWLIACAAGLLCVTACANAALLLLTRTVRRLRDTSIRMSLGAGRGRVFRQALLESLIAGVAGTGLGLVLAWAQHPFIVWLAPAEIPRLDEMTLDAQVLGFAVGVGLLCTGAAGLVSYRVMTAAAIGVTPGQLGATATTGRRTLAWRRLLLASQTAMLVVLLSAAALLLHSFWNVWRSELGFVPDKLTSFQLTQSVRGPDSDRAAAAKRLTRTVAELRMTLEGMAMFEGVALGSATPLVPGVGYTFVPQSRAVMPASQPRISALYRQVSENYLPLFGIPVIAGRGFTRADMVADAKVAILSTSLARTLFPGQVAVGQVLHWDDAFEVIGVVDDVRWLDVESAARPTFYLPATTMRGGPFHLVVRSSLPPADVSAVVADVTRRIDPLQPIDRIMPMPRVVEDARAERRFHALATAGFGLLALLLAAMGIFAGVAAAVSERLRDIGILLALGAPDWRVRWFAMRHSVIPVAVGLVGGGLGSLWVTKAIQPLLFDVSPYEPRTLGAIVVVTVAVALVASVLPAQRAVQSDPAGILLAD
jgi:putative ABC transport system permease protein